MSAAYGKYLDEDPVLPAFSEEDLRQDDTTPLISEQTEIVLERQSSAVVADRS
jgi:hypothetical protein